MKGRLITFEGPEGSGKSTQARRLAERLRGAGLEVLTTREPGGTPTGECLRGILQQGTTGEPLFAETEIFLFAASRSQLVRAVMRPAIERGAWVVCDRFGDSTTAYQGYGRGMDVETILRLNALAMGGLEPHLTILLDLDVEAGLQRARARPDAIADRFEAEAVAFHRRVRDGYHALARRWPERFRILDSTRPQDDVAADIWAYVQPLVGGAV